jgi:dolichol-phosphate mannosyltransferase
MTDSPPKIVVMVPTYNEVENIDSVVTRLLALPVPGLEVLVVDDSSPDGTGEAVRLRAGGENRLHLLSRPGPRGRGRAGKEGFAWALDHAADYIVEMDADGSHDPADLPRLLAGLKDADVCVGSRYLPGGRAEGRGPGREWISALARGYLRLVLGLRVSDPTSGYRAFTRRALEVMDPEGLTAPDPFIVTEVLYRCLRRGLKIREIPIVFRDREKGASKLKSAILFKYLLRAIQLRWFSDI